MVDLRFNTQPRIARMTLAAATLLIALALSLLTLPLVAVYTWILGIFVGLYMGVKGLVNGMISVVWYSYHLIANNWKD